MHLVKKTNVEDTPSQAMNKDNRLFSGIIRFFDRWFPVPVRKLFPLTVMLDKDLIMAKLPIPQDPMNDSFADKHQLNVSLNGRWQR